MQVYSIDEADLFEADDSEIHSYISPARGSENLCAWRLVIPPSHKGFVHRTNREEVLLLLRGQMRLNLDGEEADLVEGSVAHVHQGSTITFSTGPDGAALWVTTTKGLRAILEDGTEIEPPWAVEA
jgi:quercetin dioxygenase-like cupin family protein